MGKEKEEPPWGKLAGRSRDREQRLLTDGPEAGPDIAFAVGRGQQGGDLHVVFPDLGQQGAVGGLGQPDVPISSRSLNLAHPVIIAAMARTTANLVVMFMEAWG